MSKRKTQIENYLKQRVNPVLEPLTYDIVKAKPENILQFCLDWFIKKNKSPQNIEENVNQMSDNEEADIIDEESFKAKRNSAAKRNRSGVSAEVYGEFNRKSQFIPKIIQKSEDAYIRILILLQKSILFTSLDEKDIKIVANAMQERCFNEGEQVIQEGQDGDALYMVDEGEFDCYKIINGKQTYLKTYQVGQAFGQLALLYNAPRAASIKSKTYGRLFALDRNTFNQIVKESAIKRKQLYQQTLKKVQLLDCMGDYERSQISDVLKQSKFNAGEYIIKQGDLGDKFYIVVEGKLVAEKSQNGQKNKPVYHYKQGDYFGEIALVRNVPRQASVKALTYCKIVSIQRNAFKRILGPLEDLLKRNQERYKKFIQL